MNETEKYEGVRVLRLLDVSRSWTSVALKGGLFLFAFVTSEAFAQTSCGSCFPPELLGRAQALEQSFLNTDRDDLARQSWASEICINHPCADEVTEDQAKELLRDFFLRQQRAEDLVRADKDRQVAWTGVIIAGLSALISILALWQTHQASALARSASDRSIRNEARIEHIKQD